MFSTTWSWCWGSAPCYRSWPAGSCSPSALDHLRRWQTHFLCCQKAHTEGRTVGEQAIALCQICVPMIFVNFSDCFSLAPHFLSFLAPAGPLLPLAEEPSFPKLESGLWQTPLNVILILKDQHIQPRAAEHFEENVGHNHKVTAEHRMHRKSQFWRRGLCHWCWRF